MDASVAKVVANATALIGELDESMAPFRNEVASLLTQLQTSHTNQVALQEKAKALTSELDAARLSHSEVKQEEDELTNGLKQLQEEVARIQDDLQKGRVTLAQTENNLREVKAKIANLEASKQAGSGWTGDQVSRKEELLQARAAALKELEARRTALHSMRAEMSVFTAQLDRTQTMKIEADQSIVSLKDEIADSKTKTSTNNRMKELKERELKEAQDELTTLRAELADKVVKAEEGSKDTGASQESLRQDKAALDRCLKDFDKLRSRAIHLAEELESQMKINQTLANELNDLNESATASRSEAAKVKKEVERLRKLNDLCIAKIQEEEERRIAAEAQQNEIRRQMEELDALCEMERKKNDVKKHAVDDLRREKDVLTRGLSTVGDKSKSAEETVALQASIRRNLQAEISGYTASLKVLRANIDELQLQKSHYAAQAEEAQQAYFTAMEGVKLQELQMTALQRKIEEGNAKLKQQQSLYDAVRADRNMYSKNLAEANGEIGDMRRTYKQLSHTIDSVKGDIEAKDVSLIKEHYEHHKVEKDKEALRNELTRIQKQIQSCEQILSSQESEVSKLNAIIAEADAEKTRQAKEYESVVAEKNLLQSQLVKRDTELSVLYEKLRVQKSSLANGAAAFARIAAERDELVARIAAIKGELLVAETQTGDVGKLENEVKRLEADLRGEKTKIRALTEELERPINVHRWRALADRDPERWALIQRIQTLQKRVLEARDDIRNKEQVIAAKEKEYNKLKVSLSRQAGPEIHETIATYQSTLKSKTKQLRALEGELEAYREKVDEHKRELSRINESLDALSQDYVRRMRQARKSVAAHAAIPGSAYRGVDESALLDVSAELAAAGISNETSARLNPTHVDAVKDDADRLLAAYADMLGDSDDLATESKLSRR